MYQVSVKTSSCINPVFHPSRVSHRIMGVYMRMWD